MEQTDRGAMKRKGIPNHCGTCGKDLSLKYESTQKLNVHDGTAYCAVCACEKIRSLKNND